MEFVDEFCPSPVQRGSSTGLKTGTADEIAIEPSSAGEPVLFVFKTLSEMHVGELSLFRVYSGTLTPGMDLINQTNGKTERLNQIFMMKGKDRKEVTSLVTGDIGSVVKLKDTHTNNSLSSKNLSVSLPAIEFPDALVSAAIKPKSKGDEDKIGNGLHTLHEEDPSFSVFIDTETKETIILGQGEIHLETMIKRLKQRFGVDVEVTPPRIPYREAIKKSADVSYKHKKQSGGSGQYGEVYIKIEPKPRGEGYEFVDAIVGGVISNKFIPAVDKGIQEQLAKGVIAGYPIVDVRVTLYDGSQHTVDSNEISFKIAAQQAFRKGFMEAGPAILEPVYNIEAIVPDEFMGDVMGDISSRRGKIQGMDAEGPFQVIRAKVPLAELHQYATRLRSITQGRGLFRRSFSHYEEVPFEVMNKIVEEAKQAKEEES
jgi:elongation factor G